MKPIHQPLLHPRNHISSDKLLRRLGPPQSWLRLAYLALHTILCSTLLYIFVQSLSESHTSSRIAILLFIIANLILMVLLLSPKLSLRIAWAICGFLLLYLIIQSLSDYFASLGLAQNQDSDQAIAILYNILQARMSLILSSLFLLSSVLAMRFGKYRSIEAVVLLLLGFFLLTRDELSLSFENRYGLYRLLWLGVPSLGLLLSGLSLHPFLRHETSWLPPSFRREVEAGGAGHRQSLLLGRSKQLASFVALLLLLFAILWWTKISPVNWNRSVRGSGSGNGLLEKNLNNQFDFGEYLQLDSSLEQDRQLVMMTQIEDLPSDRPAYLTRFTLSGLDPKRNFFRDSQEPNMLGESPLPLELERGTSIFEMPEYDLRESRIADMFLLNIKPSSLFALNYPTEIQTFENWPDSSFSRVYRVKARTIAGFFPLGDPLQDYPELIPSERLNYYSYLPETYRDIGDFTRKLLPQLLANSGKLDKEGKADGQLSELNDFDEELLQNISPLEIAQLITGYFHSEYRYSLKPGIAENGDQLRYFLFESKKGYCTYFAFSAALMLRSLGIPTRIVVGFLLNPELRILNYYPLFADQAHAWIEVFDPQQGWVTFDPTTFELALGEEIEFGLPEGAEADLAALTEELLRNNLLNIEDGLQQLHPEQSAARQLLARLFESFSQRSWLLPSLLLLLVAGILLQFRARLLYLALKAQLWPSSGKHFTATVTAMYHYLQLLNYRLFAQSRTVKLPQQLHAWQQALDILQAELQQKLGGAQAQGQAQGSSSSQRKVRQIQDLLGLLESSRACLGLFGAYYFSNQFGIASAVQLRKFLQDVNPRLRRWASWNPAYLLRGLCRYYIIRRRAKPWQIWTSKLDQNLPAPIPVHTRSSPDE